MKLLTDVRIRPFGHGDEDRLRHMSVALSRVSLYTRFFSGTPRVPEPYVTALGRLDHWNRDALVALHDDAMIGLAEYARVPCHPDRAEVAVLVADAWQRHGLGALLVHMLLPLAVRRGVTEFDADVYSANAAAIALIRHSWPSARCVRSGETATFRLTALGPTPARASADRSPGPAERSPEPADRSPEPADRSPRPSGRGAGPRGGALVGRLRPAPTGR